MSDLLSEDRIAQIRALVQGHAWPVVLASADISWIYNVSNAVHELLFERAYLLSDDDVVERLGPAYQDTVRTLEQRIALLEADRDHARRQATGWRDLAVAIQAYFLHHTPYSRTPFTMHATASDGWKAGDSLQEPS